MADYLEWLIPLLSLLIFLFNLLISFFVNRFLKDKKSNIEESDVGIGKRIIFILSIIWGYYIYYISAYSNPAIADSFTMMGSLYGVTAVFIIYLILLPGLVRVYFPKFSFSNILISQRKYLGMSLYFFASAHIVIILFNFLINNLSNSIYPRTPLSFLFNNVTLSLLSGSISFGIFTLLIFTPYKLIGNKVINRYIKNIHKLLYIAAIFILSHVFLIDSHYLLNPNLPLSVIFVFLSTTFILLELGAVFKKSLSYENKRYLPRTIGITIILIGLICLTIYFSRVGISYIYDPIRYNLGFNNLFLLEKDLEPKEIYPGQSVKINFKIKEKDTKRTLNRFLGIQGKPLHLIIIKNDFSYFDHLNPTYNADNSFSFETKFPKAGKYFIFAEFSPYLLYKSVVSATVQVQGIEAGTVRDNLSPDILSKNIEGKYLVKLDNPAIFKVNKLLDLEFTVHDLKTSEIITNIEDYDQSMGFLVAVSENLEDYNIVYTYPYATNAVKFRTVFTNSGKYRLFLQFKYKNAIQTADFRIEVK